MKRFICLIVLAFLLNVDLYAQQFPRVHGLYPQRGAFGIGISLGEPTGFSSKYWTTNSRALDFNLGASFYNDYRFNVVYLFHIDAFKHQRLPFHYGFGFTIIGESRRVIVIPPGNRRYINETGLGPRGVMGISYLLPSAPFDLFLQMGSNLLVVPYVALDIDWSVGVRYYF